MATATKTITKVTKTVEVDEEGIQLTLTLPEARLIKALVDRVTGPDDGPRGNSNKIWSALSDAGISGYAERQLMKNPGTIWFDRYPG